MVVPIQYVGLSDVRHSQALERRINLIGIDLPSWRAKMCLYEGEYLSLSEIAEFSAQKLNTMTKVIQRMLNDGLVSTRIRPTDKRVTEVCLTVKGDKLRELAFAEAQEVFEHIFKGVDAEDNLALNGTLSGIHERLQKL